jgi:hypothetical protein
LRTENSAADNTANTSRTNQGSGAKGALPLSSNVVCLPCQDARYIGVASSGGNEDAKVANANVIDEAEKRET